jgi:hypothetical protein
MLNRYHFYFNVCNKLLTTCVGVGDTGICRIDLLSAL